jgi:iron(III) transport system substrate-binding protein
MRHDLAGVAVLVMFSAGFSAARAEDRPGTLAGVVAGAQQEGKLVIYSTTDRDLVAPLLKDFNALYPEIALDYRDMNSSEIYDRAVSEIAAKTATADVLWSSAMDLQVKLAVDGHALAYKSPEASHLPGWASWRNEVFGTTFEPISFVYNRRLLQKQQVPGSHAELVKALKDDPAKWKGRVACYDPERSAIGLLLMTQDAKADPNFDDTERAYGAAGVKLYTSANAMLEKVQSGEHLVAFNVFGSYAAARQKKDSAIGIVYPKDYTLVTSRIALITRAAKHPNAARAFIDYVLSRRGQEFLATASLFSIHSDVQGVNTAAALTREIGGRLRPLPVTPSLIAHLDGNKRAEFLEHWRGAVAAR